MTLKGPFKLDIRMGYATVYDGNDEYIPELVDIELGWTDTSTGIYVSPAEAEGRLQDIVDLMNIGWGLKDTIVALADKFNARMKEYEDGH